VDYSTSYKALIRDTAEVAANRASEFGIKSFAYISAASFGTLGNIILPKYMIMKEEAEKILTAHSEFRTVIVRPGFMYGSDRWATIPISLGVSAMTLFTAGMFPRALCVDTVARATFNELSSPDRSNVILDVADISRKGAL
jgi:nucleoside-diphosphate-sugar epimerase